jgi:carboxymethylenebutenolidase
LREKLKEAKQPWKINLYPEAGHAFFNDTRPSYNARAARDAWRETLEFLKQHVV